MAYAVPSSKTLFASAARTTAQTGDDQYNLGYRGLHCVIDLTAVAGSPSLTFTLQGKDRLSGKYYTLLASAALTGTGTTVLRLYPDLTASANVTVNDVLPECWRLNVAVGTADSVTYSVGVSLLP